MRIHNTNLNRTKGSYKAFPPLPHPIASTLYLTGQSCPIMLSVMWGRGGEVQQLISACTQIPYIRRHFLSAPPLSHHLANLYHLFLPSGAPPLFHHFAHLYCGYIQIWTRSRNKAVFWLHVFFCLPDPDLLVRGMNPDPDPSIIMQKQ